MWAPGEIDIMIHHHTTAAPYERSQSPFYRDTMRRLTELGLLEYNDGIPRSTPLGQAFVANLCQTPVPIAIFVDPRFQGGGHDQP